MKPDPIKLRLCVTCNEMRIASLPKEVFAYSTANPSGNHVKIGIERA